MKRIGNLYDAISTPENIRDAILKASRGKRDRPAVRAVLEDLDNKTQELAEAFRTETVQLNRYTADVRTEGSRNKRRIIHKPRFWPDQCVHWAVYNVMRQRSRPGPTLRQAICGKVDPNRPEKHPVLFENGRTPFLPVKTE